MKWLVLLGLLPLSPVPTKAVPATSAGIGLVQGLAVARSGDVYLATQGSGGQALVLKLSPHGELGVVGPYGLDRLSWRVEGRAPHEPLFDRPVAAVVEAGDVLLVLDEGGSLVRVDPGARVARVVRIGDKRLLRPRAMLADGKGGLLVGDAGSHSVFRYDSARATLTRIAGVGIDGTSGDGASADHAHLAGPQGLALDFEGNLYVADRDNARIRRVDPSGRITSLPATGERLERPVAVAALPDRSLLVGDVGRHQVLRLSRSGPSSVLPGLGPVTPTALAVTPDGAVLVFDLGRRQLLRWRAGQTTVAAGDGGAGYCGDGGPAVEADVGPTRVLADPQGGFFLADPGHDRVRAVDAKGLIRTIAGNGLAAFAGDGGPGPRGSLSRPRAIAWERAGTLLIADTGNNRIRRLENGVLSTAYGTGAQGSDGDGGPATAASFDAPTDVVVAADGAVFVAHTRGRVRRIDGRTQIVTTVVGGDGLADVADGDRPTDGHLGRIQALALHPDGSLFIAEAVDNGSPRLRRLDPRTGVLSTVRGGESFHSLTGLDAGTGGPVLLAADMQRGLVELALGPGEWRVRGGAGPTQPPDGRLASEARFSPVGVTSLADGRLLVCTVDGLFSIDSDGRMTRVAGGGFGF
ncbi:MAG TPA: NHL repeat-containing protein [Vicinamibacteria bacterium]|nr:NHL repeat-containing protein [Vicinamibacteria bacterium]